MPKAGVKNQTQREGSLKFETEPEEGEIVDDYDLIVSSDEELNMRQRIRELEAENEEIEQIAVISRSYVDKISHQHNYLESCRAAQVPTDASSISSTEFVTPQKRKRGKSREGRRKRCHRQHPREHHQYDETVRFDLPKLPHKSRSRKAHCKRRQKLFAKKHKKLQSDRFIHKEANTEVLSLESLDSSDSSAIDDRDNCSNNIFINKRRNESFDKGKHITRDTLRLAVARNTNECKLVPNKNCLKDKLLRQELVTPALNAGTNDQYDYAEGGEIRDENEEDDDDVQVIENEPVIQTIEDDSTDSMEEKELRLIALKSAVLKKHMARKKRNATVAYSPTDFDEMLSSGILQQDHQIDDIDVVDLEAEDSQTACVIISPEASPQLTMLEDQEESQQMVDCKPVDMDIANSDSEDATIDSWTKDVDSSLHKYSIESFDFSKSIHYDFYMQKLNDLPPPPPGVDDYENVPPPPPYHVFYNAESQSMRLHNEDLMKDQQNTAANFDKQTNTVNKLTLPLKKACVNEEEDEEEEEALRALLLSKFQSPKNQKKTRNLKEINELKEKCSTNVKEQPLQSHGKTKPTEFILKEAVKRLKIHSHPEVLKEKSPTDFYVEEKNRRIDEPHDYHQINSDNIFEKLRDRVNIYNNQSQLNAEQSGGIEDTTLNESKEFYTKPYTSVDMVGFVPINVQMRNVIDESEITRRLQEIRENVSNSTYKRAFKDEHSNLDSVSKDVEVFQSNRDVTERVENSNPPAEQSFCQSTCLLANNLTNVAPKNTDMNKAIARTKTVKSNFDVATNQTTFKVTINNNVTLKSEEMILTHKENNVNNVPKNMPMKINGKACKVAERLVKISNKTTESNGDKNAQVNQPLSVFKPILKDNFVSKPPHSVLRTTKIVKPNKVINTNIGLKPKEVLKATMATSKPKPSKLETSNKFVKVPDNSRLITSIDQVKYMCKVAPFVISLQNSSNESSEDEFGGDYNSLYQPLYEYNDNASPLSLNLESPSITPLRSNSPTDTYTDYCIQNTNLEAFNLKAKAIPIPKEERTVNSRVFPTIPHDPGDKINKTPLAVRHLPAAAQSEYRRLVHRMKLLENKRKLANIEGSKMEGISADKTDTSSSHTDAVTKEKCKTDSVNSTPKSSLVKTVLLRNANNNTTPTDIVTDAPSMPKKSSCSSKLDKNKVLRSYENLYTKFGAGIVSHLDKSIKLVEDAKKAKMAKLKLENRLKELKTEMEILQGKHKEEQQKISCIYPIICNTNEVITSLKQKRSKVFKAALNLGKSLKGEDYRLNNDLKEIITTKSKKLAIDIKNVNSLKAQNIKTMEEVQNPNPSEQQQAASEKKNIDDDIAKSTANSLESRVNAGSSPDKPIEEKNNVELRVKNELGGNTEFQDLEDNNSKALENPTEFCDPNENAKIMNECLEDDAKQTISLPSYISPLEHLRNIGSNVDPNGVVCPYDLMGNCEDVACKYVHITPKAKT